MAVSWGWGRRVLIRGKNPKLERGFVAEHALAKLLGDGILPRARVRVWPFKVAMSVIATILGLRLMMLTVIEGQYHRAQAEANRVVAIRTTAARGIIYDQQGVALTVNEPIYRRQLPGTTLTQTRFEIISREEALALTKTSGERIFFDIKRSYPCGRACAPILGYMGEIDENELAVTTGDYVLGDFVGKGGLEKEYESFLRGVAGSELMEIDAHGAPIRAVGKVEQRPGQDLHATIDVGLQQVLYQALEGRMGAAVATVPQTGEVLALVSSPAFDPNNIAGSLAESDQPFFNRSVQGVYAPGSVFKVVLAVAGLETGEIEPETTIEDTGEIRVGSFRYGNWYFDKYGRTEGLVDVVKALQRSNDIFFYRLGEKLGPELIREWALLFGYEKKPTLTGLGEVAGLIPSPLWKEKTVGEKWFLGNTYHMAIGQGDVMVTPLQVNRMMATVAANGSRCDPVMAKREVGKESCSQLNLQVTTLEAVKLGLKNACSPGGTGAPLFQFKPTVACKTGTAQQGGDTAHPHAWVTVYAPADNPEIALTVLVEKAGEGSEVAAPIAKVGLEYWFGQGKED